MCGSTHPRQHARKDSSVSGRTHSCFISAKSMPKKFYISSPSLRLKVPKDSPPEAGYIVSAQQTELYLNLDKTHWF